MMEDGREGKCPATDVTKKLRVDVDGIFVGMRDYTFQVLRQNHRFVKERMWKGLPRSWLQVYVQAGRVRILVENRLHSKWALMVTG